ncbi:putative rrna methyltransferase [Phaeomoniella chlamydospora]|uniref:Putative rrna methyltransferase n=1 Tax=Phaeomoniella chlamydospora TaxID=158046 RepID=A0A0G2E9A3_PHACM|nr:putative rrna methyltransferase [Phaeomoniella chlamydospora]
MRLLRIREEMAIQKKHGKGRLDKWYKLAKEKGYRARAAFKLIQLNKKYGFLEKSKVLLDLCAAPGSWTQVAAETMPAGALIIGVDLAPIKPIPRAITFQSDITTDKCRATLRGHLKGWKADTVLHDGAPNVGTAWVQDAFSQAELVLMSLKLAVDFLAEGGTFVTKVFRSKDYNALLWVFKQLFTSVEATKPPSSRNVSAEIFVVCRGYKAPKRVDPKFLDSRHVFAEVSEPTPNNEAKVFNPEKKKRKREGYEEGDYTQHKEIPVTEFIHTTDPIAILGTVNKLSFDQAPNGDLALATLDRLPETTAEIRTCCQDLKILGRKEFRTLLRWRLKVRDIFGLTTKAKKQQAAAEEAEVTQIEPMDEELAIQEELQRLKDQESSKKKKERRRENERKQKEIVRMQMNMTAPMDIGVEQVGPNGEGAMFNLKTADKAKSQVKLTNGKMEVADEESSESDLELDDEDDESDPEADRLDRELDAMYESYRERREDRDSKERAKRLRKLKEEDEWEGFSGSEKDKAGSEDEDEDEDIPMRPLKGTSDGLSSKAAMFFDQDIFQGIDGLDDPELNDDSAIEMDDGSEETIKAPNNGVKLKAKATKESKPSQDDMWEDSEDEEVTTSIKPQPKSKSTISSKKNTNNNKIEIVPTAAEPETWDNSKSRSDPRTPSGALDIDIITAEAMTLAREIASGVKTTTDLEDDNFNKYTFRGDLSGLPEWFLDDETKHSQPNRPISAAAAGALREKLRALNARPIKKVLEAKGRKKFKAAQKLEKLRRKSALLADDEGISERDKANSIAKLMSRAAKKKPKEKVKLVVAKGGNRGISGRPRGVKGKYKIVDKRLKKDVRAEKRVAKKQKKGGARK